MTFADRLEFTTSEGVRIEMTIAGMGSRMLAWMLDGLIIFAFLFLAGVGSTIVFSSSELLGAGVVALLVVFFPMIYLVAMETLNGGRTIGKMAVGLKVIRTTGAPAGFGPCLVRGVFVLVDYLMGGVGVICMLVTAKAQRFGDLAAKTVVVRDRVSANSAPVITNRPPPPGAISTSRYGSPLNSAEAPERWDVSLVTPEEITAIRTFLERIYGMDYASRIDIGRRLVERIKPRVQGASSKMNQEEWLRRVVASKES